MGRRLEAWISKWTTSRLHFTAGFAIILYTSLVFVGGLAGRHLLSAGFRMASYAAFGIALATAIFLWLSLGDSASGLYQRLGITTPTVWLMAVALRGGPVPVR